MSDVSDPRSGDQAVGGVSEEQARAYADQLRSAPVEQLTVELLGNALNAAQAKLGRNDARLFIDLGGLLFEHSRPYLTAELATQVEQALGQLRLVQVEAESAPNREVEEGDLPAPPAPANQPDGGVAPGAGQESAAATDASVSAPRPDHTQAGSAGPGSTQASSTGPSKLWLPGRDF